MKLKVGELYSNPMLGLCIITNIYDRSQLSNDDLYFGQIGTLERVGFGDRVYKLYTDTKLREATDSDIKEHLLNKMTRFELDDKSSVFVDNEYLFISDQHETITLNKEAALKLKEILNRELV